MRNPVSSIKNRYDARKRSELVAKADTARNAKNWRVAAGLYREVLDLLPSDADIWVQFGHMQKESGALDEAEAAYRKSIALRPRFSDTHLMLGHVLKFKGNLKDALESYRLAVELDSNDPRARDEFATLSRKLASGNHSDSKDTSMEPASSSSDAMAADLRVAGDKARDVRNWTDAAAAYKAYLAMRPEDAAIWVQMAHVLKESGYYDAADAAYSAAEKLTPNVADTFLHHAHLLKGMGRTDDAIKAFRRLAALSPGDTEAAREIEGLSRKVAPPAAAPVRAPVEKSAEGPREYVPGLPPQPQSQPQSQPKPQPAVVSAPTEHLEAEIREMRDRLGKAEEQLRLMQGQSRALRVLSSELVKARQEVSALAPRITALEAENRDLRVAHEERLEALEAKLNQVRDLDPRHPFLLVEQHLSRRGKADKQ